MERTLKEPLFTKINLFYPDNDCLFFYRKFAIIDSKSFITRFIWGIITTATGTVISQIIPTNRRGEGIGYFSMSNILATW